MNPIMAGGLKILFFLWVIPFALLISWMIYDKFAENKRFINKILPYFQFLYEKYGARHIVMMYDSIEDSSFEILPTDRKKAFIFFTEDCLIITKINNPSYEYVIPKENLTGLSHMYYQSHDQYWIKINFIKDGSHNSLEFETYPLTSYTREFREEHRDVIGAEEFLKEVQSVTRTSSKGIFDLFF